MSQSRQSPSITPSSDKDYRALMTKALIELKKTKSQLRTLERAKSEPIAIIGMACRFPAGADTPASFWQLLNNGVDAISEVPASRWDIDAYYDPELGTPGKMYTRYGGFLSEVDGFDAQFFGISPREATSLDPQQRLLLEVSWEALEHAHLVPSQLSESRSGVFIGVCLSDYLRLATAEPQHIDAYVGTGTSPSAAAGRLSYFLGLQGPSMVVDTACSSSLVSVHLACQSLRAGECDLALAGGVNLLLSPEGTINFCQARMMAADGRCKTFDASADGYTRGEGCGMIVLKRLSDAIRDSDAILALIRGSAVNHDGPSGGLTVPNGLSQQAVIRQALKNAGVAASQVSYVESHGTGTSLGDPIEMEALGAVYGSRSQPLIVGSVKTNIGHLEGAAGIAGIIKVVLSLQNKAIPAHLHFREPNPHIPWDDLSVRVPTERTPWLRGKGGEGESGRVGEGEKGRAGEGERGRGGEEQKRRGAEKRIAGVSSFGFSGTNAHVILEEAPAQEVVKANVEQPLHLLTLSAKTEPALQELLSRYTAHLGEQETDLADICFTANTGRRHFKHRLAVVAADKAQMRGKLSAFGPFLAPEGAKKGRAGDEASGIFQETVTQAPQVAFLFTGQGSQYVGMGQELYETQPTFRKTINQCDEILRPYLSFPLLSLLESTNQHTVPELVEGPTHQLNQTAYTQVGLFALEYALAKLWQSWGVVPDVVMGHGVGELVAACVAGVFSLEDGLKLTGALNSDFRRIRYLEPRISLISSVTGGEVSSEVTTPEYWVRHIHQPVRFTDSMNTLIELGIDTFVEIGPKPTLLAMARRIYERSGVDGYFLPSLRPHQEWSTLFSSVGQLYVRGASIDWKGFAPTGHDNQAYRRQKAVLPTYPWQRKRYWVAAKPNESVAFSQKASFPLVGQRLRLPLSSEIRFESQYSPNSPPYLDDHRLYGTVVVPAASHISMALSAVCEALHTESCILEALFFPQALVFSGRTIRTVQLLLTSDGREASLPGLGGIEGGLPVASFQIVSLKEGEDENEATSWFCHARGKVKSVKTWNASAEWLDLEAIQARCRANLWSGQELYEALWEAGYTLGASFRWVGPIWRGEGEALCQMELPQLPDEVSAYQLYPGLIDSCFQLLSCCGPVSDISEFTKQKQINVPFSIASFRFFRRPSRSQLHSPGMIWCHAKATNTLNHQSLTADIRLFDETGQLIAEIIGFEARKVDHSTLVRSQWADWLYEIAWEAKAAPAQVQSMTTDAGSWLIFADRPVSERANHKSGIGVGLAQMLKERGEESVLVFAGETYRRLREGDYQINPAKRQDFERLLTEIPANIKGVVHLWSLDSEIGHDLKEAQRLTVGSALHLVQALTAAPQNANRYPRLWLVTRGATAAPHAQASADSEGARIRIEPQQRMIWGVGKVIALEHPELSTVCLDFAPEPTPNERENQTQTQTVLDTLLAELRSPDRENEIAYRAGVRYVARLVRQRERANTSLVIDNNSSYLITGGLGALGLKVAEWLVQQGARRVVLTGRRGGKREEVKQLEEAGAQVKVVKADVSNPTDVARVLEACDKPLRGIVHAAGVLDDGVLAGQSIERFEKVMAPKVQGAWNLHTLTQDNRLDFFVCFSSAASLLGSAGQGNYAAANAFMDGLAHHRRALGLPALSINWGPWAQVGMAASLPSVVQGMKKIDLMQGLQIFSDLAGSGGTAQVGVLRVDWPTFWQQFPAGHIPPLFSELNREVWPQGKEATLRQAQGTASKVKSATSQPSPLRQQLESATPRARQKLLMAYLEDEVARILAYDGRLNPKQGFFEMGLDSLMGLDLRSRLQSTLGISLSSTLALDYSNLEDLTTYLSEMLVPSAKAHDGRSQDVPESKRTEPLQEVRALAEVESLSEAYPAPESAKEPFDRLRDQLDMSIEEELAKLEALLKETHDE